MFTVLQKLQMSGRITLDNHLTSCIMLLEAVQSPFRRGITMTRIARRVFLLLLCTCACFLTYIPNLRAEDLQTPPSLIPYPPGAEIFFRDSFMREKPEEGEWTQICGKWEFDQMAKPGVSANPFSVVGSSKDEAMLVTGYDWWRNYYFNAALRTPPIYNSFGVVYCFRGRQNFVFFGFSQKDGLVLQLTLNGSDKQFAVEKKFAVPYQWYDVGIAISGKTVVAMLDRRPVFTVELPFELSGKAGVRVTGAPDYGMTVDDCSATGFKYDRDAMLADSKNGFSLLLASDRLSKPKFPVFFERDRLMRKWASADADWYPFEVPTVAEGEQPQPPTSYSFPLPMFNDIAMQVKLPGLVWEPYIELRKQKADGVIGDSILRVQFIPKGKLYTVICALPNGKELINVPDVTGQDGIVEVFCTGDKITFGAVNGAKYSETVSQLARELNNGVRVIISREMFEVVKFGNFNLDSSSFFEDTFYNSPSNWMTVFGNWEIASRWACNPIYTYLSSWDRMSSQLYCKHLFGGDVYCEVWFSPKMASLSRPSYYPIQWFSVSNPSVAGDLSTGYTCAIATPDSDSMSLFYNGKSISTTKLRGAMSGGNLHHTWFHLLQTRLSNRLSYDLNFIDERDDPRIFTVEDKRKQDLKPQPFAIWNSLTGLTVTRVRLTAREIVWGGMNKSLYNRMPTPCGVKTSVQNPSDPFEFIAPSYDFSKGSAGWYVSSSQPAIITSPYPNDNNRTGIAVTSPFCGSRMEFVSPDMSVDSRVYQNLTVKYRTDVSLDLYIHSGSRKFRVPLDSDKKAETLDWAIPVGKRYYTKSKAGGYDSVKIDLVQMFEEYQTLDIPPIIDKLTFERIDDSDESLGVTSRDKMFFAVSEVAFSSPFKPEVNDQTAPLFSGDPQQNDSVREFVSGYRQNKVVLTPEFAATSLPKQGEKKILERAGAIILEFTDGMQKLSPIGAVDETLLWRKRENKENLLIAHKSGRFGFFGVKVLPEPVTSDQYPAMAIKLKGNTDLLCLGVKAGDWQWIPLKTGSKIRRNSSDSKFTTICPVVITDNDYSWIVCYFPDHPKLAEAPIFEEVILCSVYGAPPPTGESIAISSVIFFDPSKLSRFASLSKSEITVTRDGVAIAGISEAKVRNVETFLISLKTPKSPPPPSNVTATLRDSLIEFAFDRPLTPSELAVKIGEQEFSWRLFRFKDGAKTAMLERDEVFNSTANGVKWTAKVGSKTVGDGVLDFQAARPPAIRRAMVIPEDSLVFEDYEYGMGTAGSRGTPIFLASAFPFMGSSYIENLDPAAGSVMGYLVRANIDAVRYPNMSFACRLNKALVNLHFKCEGHFKDVAISPSDVKQGKSYWTQGVFGELAGIRDNDRWQTVKFKILDKLQGTPFNGKYFITEIAIDTFKKSEPGGSICIDNLCIYGDRSTYYTVVVEPPAGLDAKTKFAYEWWFVDATNRPLSLSQLSKLERFRADIPDTKPAKIRVRLHINGEMSQAITDLELP